MCIISHFIFEGVSSRDLPLRPRVCPGQSGANGKNACRSGETSHCPTNKKRRMQTEAHCLPLDFVALLLEAPLQRADIETFVLSRLVRPIQRSSLNQKSVCLIDTIPFAQDFMLTEATQILTLASKYKMTILVDMSSSTRILDSQTHTSLFETILTTLSNCLRGLAQPLDIVGCSQSLQINVSVVVMFCSSTSDPTYRVMVHNHSLTAENVDCLVETVVRQLNQYENDVARLALDPTDSLSMVERAEAAGALRILQLVNDTMTSPFSPAMVWITDSVTRSNDLDTMTEVRRILADNVALTIVQVGSPLGFTPAVSFSHLPNNEIIRFIAHAAEGQFIYASDCPENASDSQGTMGNLKLNFYHQNFLSREKRFLRATPDEKIGQASSGQPRPADVPHNRIVQGRKMGMIRDFGEANQRYPWTLDSEPPASCEVMCHYRDYQVSAPVSQIISARLRSGFSIQQVIHQTSAKSNRERVEVILISNFFRNVTIQYRLKYYVDAGCDLLQAPSRRMPKIQVNILAHQMFAMLFIAVSQIEFIHEPVVDDLTVSQDISQGNTAFHKKLIELHTFLRLMRETDENIKTVNAFPTRLPRAVAPGQGEQTNYWQYLSQILLSDVGSALTDAFQVHIVLRTTSASLVLPNFDLEEDNQQRGRRSVAMSYLAQFLRDRWATLTISKQVYLKTAVDGFFLTKLHWESDCLLRLEVLAYNVPHAIRLQEFESMHNQINELQYVATSTRLNNLKRPVYPLLATKQPLGSLAVHYSRNLETEETLKKSHARTAIPPLLRSYFLRWRWYYHAKDVPGMANSPVSLDSLSALAIRELTFNRLSDGFVIIAEGNQGVCLFREYALSDARTTTVQCAVLRAEDALAIVDVWIEPGLNTEFYNQIQSGIGKLDKNTLAYLSTYYRLQSPQPLDFNVLHETEVAADWQMSPYSRPLLNSPWLWTRCNLPFGLNVLSRKAPVLIATFPTANGADDFAERRSETQVMFATLRSYFDQNSQGCITDYLSQHHEVSGLWQSVQERLDGINQQHGSNFVAFQPEDLNTYIIRTDNGCLLLVSTPMGYLGQDGFANFAIVVVELPVPEVGLVPNYDFRSLEEGEESPEGAEMLDQMTIYPRQPQDHGIVLIRIAETIQTKKKKDETLEGLQSVLETISLGYNHAFVSSIWFRLLMGRLITKEEQEKVVEYCERITRVSIDIMPWMEARKANQDVHLTAQHFKRLIDDALEPYATKLQMEKLLMYETSEWYGLHAKYPDDQQVEHLMLAAQHPVFVRLHFQAGNVDVSFADFCDQMDLTNLLQLHVSFYGPTNVENDESTLLRYQKDIIEDLQQSLTWVIRACAVQECVESDEGKIPSVSSLEIALHQLIVPGGEPGDGPRCSRHKAIHSHWVNKLCYSLFVALMDSDLPNWHRIEDYRLKLEPNGFNVIVLHEDCIDLVHFNAGKDEYSLDELANVVQAHMDSANRVQLLKSMEDKKQWNDDILQYSMESRQLQVPVSEQVTETRLLEHLRSQFASRQLTPRHVYIFSDPDVLIEGQELPVLVSFDFKEQLLVDVSSTPPASEKFVEQLKLELHGVVDAVVAERILVDMMDGVLSSNNLTTVMVHGSGPSRMQTNLTMPLIRSVSVATAQELLYLARFHATALRFDEQDATMSLNTALPTFLLHYRSDKTITVAIMSLETKDEETFGLDGLPNDVLQLMDLDLTPVETLSCKNSFIIRLFTLGQDAAKYHQEALSKLDKALELAQTDLLLDRAFQAYRVSNQSQPSNILDATTSLLEHAAKLQHSLVQEVSCQVNLSPTQLNDFVIELRDQMDELEPDLKLVLLGNETQKKTAYCDMSMLQQRSFAAFPRVAQPEAGSAYLIEPSLYCVAVPNKVIAWTHGCNKATAESIMSSIVKILSWHSLRNLFGTTDNTSRFPASRTLQQSKTSSSLHTVSTLDLNTLDKALHVNKKADSETFGDDVLQRQCAEVIANYIKSQTGGEQLSGVVQAINSVRVLITVNEPLLFVCPHLRETVLGIPRDDSIAELQVDLPIQTWLRQLCDDLIARYSAYLETLGFQRMTIVAADIQSDNPRFAMCESKSIGTSPNYLVYTIMNDGEMEGRILAQVGVQGTFLCVNWFTIRDPGQGASKVFADECLRLKSLAHVQSFMYDWHLNVFFSATNRNASSLVPMHLLDLFRSFLSINPKRARFARDTLVSEQYIGAPDAKQTLIRLAKYAPPGLRPIYYETSLIALCIVSQKPDFDTAPDDSDQEFALFIDLTESSQPGSIQFYLLAVDKLQRFPFAVDPPHSNLRMEYGTPARSVSGDKTSSLPRPKRVNSVITVSSGLAQSLARRGSKDYSLRLSMNVNLGDVVQAAKDKMTMLWKLGKGMQKEDVLWAAFVQDSEVDDEWVSTFLTGSRADLVDLEQFDPRMERVLAKVDGLSMQRFLQKSYKSRILPSGIVVFFKPTEPDQVILTNVNPLTVQILRRTSVASTAFVQDFVNVILSWMLFQ